MFNTFPPSARVRHKTEYQRVFALQRRFFGRFCVAYLACNDEAHARLGVVVSKRNVRKAVARNRVKRIAREVFRKQQKGLPAIDIVIVAKRSADEATKKELQLCLKQLIAQVESSASG